MAFLLCFGRFRFFLFLFAEARRAASAPSSVSPVSEPFSANRTSLNRSMKLHTSSASPANPGSERRSASGTLGATFFSRAVTCAKFADENASGGVPGPSLGKSSNSELVPSSKGASHTRSHSLFACASIVSFTFVSASSALRRSLASRAFSLAAFVSSRASARSFFSLSRSAALASFSASLAALSASLCVSTKALCFSFSAFSFSLTASRAAFSAARRASRSAFSSASRAAFAARAAARSASRRSAPAATAQRCSTLPSMRSTTRRTSSASRRALTCSRVSPGFRAPAAAAPPPGRERLAVLGALTGVRP